MNPWLPGRKTCKESGLLEMQRNAASVLKSVKMLSTRNFNHKLFCFHFVVFFL